LRDLHGILSGHAVGDEENLVRVDRCFETFELLHHVVVDLQTPGGIDDHHTIACALGLLDAGLGNSHDVLRIALGIDRHIELCAERLELIDGRRSVDVAGDKTRRPILGLELSSELGGGGRFSRSLETDHHHDGWRNGAELEALAPFSEHRGELVVHDFDELLARRDRPDLRNADRFFLDALEELPRELEVDVGLEQHATHLTEAFFDVGFGENAATA